jgi:sulfate adenylyltransferase subunit 2
MAKTESKKEAVRLRQEGKSLAQITALTGLSRPTIVKACKAFLNDKDSPKPLGRPKLQSKYINPGIIASLVESQCVFAPVDLKIYIEKELNTPINSRSFAHFIEQIGWAKATDDKKNIKEKAHSYQVHTIHDDNHGIYILSAQNSKIKPCLSFHRQAPKDSHYLQMAKKLFKSHPSQLEIDTDIPDLKYCPQLLLWQQEHPEIVIHSAHLKASKENAVQSYQSTVQTSPSNRGTNMKIKTDTLTHLQLLEAESIHIMREVIAEADNPVMLYSIGKDSAVMLHLALKAFYPAKLPFPLLHVDTTWKFQDMYRFRAEMVKKFDLKLLIHTNPDGLLQGINPFTHGSQIHTDIMKTQALKQALDQHQFDVAFGGARRDEEKSRAKERIFSFRNAQHRWDPKNQRPELWNLYNTKKNKGESIRVFPLSNWTELDIWQYIYLENIPIVPLYFSQKRPVVNRDGGWIMVDDDRMPLHEGEIPQMKNVRFRTLGCYPLTGAVESNAQTLPEIIQEMLLTTTSERQGRVIDHDSNSSMEKKKQEGYF